MKFWVLEGVEITEFEAGDEREPTLGAAFEAKQRVRGHAWEDLSEEVLLVGYDFCW